MPRIGSLWVVCPNLFFYLWCYYAREGLWSDSKVSLVKNQKIVCSQARLQKAVDLLFELTSLWACLLSELCFVSFTKKLSDLIFVCHFLLLSMAEAELVFVSLRSDPRENQVESFFWVLQQFYYAREERKAQSVHHCQVENGCWWSRRNDANQAFCLQEHSTFRLCL